MKYNVSPDLIE